MAVTDFLPKEYGYVVIVVVFYCLLNLWMGFQVGGARKRYKVPYPTLYAIESENKNAKLFNCVQRGHQNSLEMMPMYFILMILGGMKHPCICTGLGLLYNVSRFFYFKGYSTGVPKNRLTIGKYGFLAMSGLAVCAISFAITFASQLSLRLAIFVSLMLLLTIYCFGSCLAKWLESLILL